MNAPAPGLRVIERLALVLADPELPERARRVGTALFTRLTAPVRIAVLGPPGSGKSDVVGLLLGATPLPITAGVPTALHVYGPQERLTVTREDGRAETLADLDDLFDEDLDTLLMLRVEAPIPILERISLLEVVADAHPDEMADALAWAAARSDMAIWCSTDFSPDEAAIWSAAPNHLRDHAFLVLSGDTEPSEARLRGTFARCDRMTDAEGAAGLRSAILSHVDRGRSEDMDGALLFLGRYGAHLLLAESRFDKDNHPGRRAGDLGPVGSWPARLPQAPTPPEGTEAAANPLASTGIEILRKAAAEIDPDDAPDAILARCLDTVDTLMAVSAPAARAGGEAAAFDRSVGDASDLITLLQLEGDASASDDAVHVLLQLRRELDQMAA